MKNTTFIFRTLLLSALLLSISTIHGQENNSLDKVIESYKDYFKIDRKAIHLHTNKTIFTTGEHIWFSAYLFNKKTNNMAIGEEYIHINLIDSKGEILSSKTILYANGSASGEFFIETDLNSGDYYLQAYTPHMNDFYENDSKVLPIQILNFGIEKNETITSIDFVPQVKITPESGTLLKNELGTIGIQIQDKTGKPIIPDSTFLETTQAFKRKPINISPLGTGQIAFISSSNTKYVVTSYWDNQVIKTAVPFAENKGYVLSAKPNLDQKNIWIHVKSKFEGVLDSPENLKLVLHKDGNIIPVDIKTNTSSWSDDIIISFEQLYPGVNTLSLIANDNKVVAERLVYNPDTHTAIAPQILKVDKVKDSIKLWVKSGNKTNTQIENLSVSILPLQNLSTGETQKMSASFYLSDYFTKDKLALMQSLDKTDSRFLNYAINSTLLHKTTGKYAWHNILSKKKLNTSTNKLTSCIEGYIKPDKKLKDSKVMLFSEANRVFETTSLNEKMQFTFNNLNLKEKSKFTLTLLNEKGKPLSSLFFFTLKPGQSNFRHAFKPEKQSNPKQYVFTDSLQFFKKIEKLKEVEVIANKLKYQKFLPQYQGVKIDSTLQGAVTLGNFVIRYGIRVSLIPHDYFDLRRAGKLQHFKACTLQNGDVFPIFPRIIFNGQFSAYFDDFAGVRLEDIDEIYTFINYGGPCNSRTFVVFTHPDYEFNPIPKQFQKSKEFVVENGYHQPKAFTSPDYLSTTGDEFKKFGVVSWFPKISTEKDGVFTIKVPDVGHNKLKLNLQGYTLSQNYLSESLVIDLENYK